MCACLLKGCDVARWKKMHTWSERGLSSPSSVHFSFSANTPLLAPLLLYIPKSETYGQSTRLCTIFYFFDHPQGNVSRFIWLIAYKSKNNIWGHLVCSYHTVLSHCEQHEKQTDRNKDVIELNFNRNWFNVHIKLIGWQKGTIFCLWLLRINSQLDFKASLFFYDLLLGENEYVDYCHYSLHSFIYKYN